MCPGYELHTRLRFRGGTCVFVRNDVSCHREEDLEPADYDVILLKISSKGNDKFVCVLYLSPNDNSHGRFFSYLCTTFDHLQENYPDAEVIFLGDFNVHNIPWLRFSSRTDDAGRGAEAFAISCGLTQLVEEPTRVPDRQDHQAYLLDLFLTTAPDSYTLSVLAPLGRSDHKVISAQSTFFTPPVSKAQPRRVWHYSSAKWTELKDHFAYFPWCEICFRSNDPSSVAKSITETILESMEIFIPFTDKKPIPEKPWFNKKCARAVSKKNAEYRNWRNNKSESTRKAFIEARNSCNTIIDEAKNMFDQRARNRLLNCPNGSKSFWGFAKNIGKNFTSSAFPPLIGEDNTTAVTAKEKADLFASMFAKNSTLDSKNKVPPPLPAVDAQMHEIVFKHRTIKRILLNLDTSKASGLDGISPIVLKKCALELTPVLCKLFSLSYKSGIFPSTWKSARVQPVPKKGKKNVASNYRPISIIPIMSKVMEKAINMGILKYLERHSIISDRQYGFRQRRSTGDLLAYVTHLWTSTLERYGESRVVALDISKAFDQVWHESLLSKLPSYGLPTKLCRLIHSFLDDRTLQVVVDGVSSKTLKINAGVPQGSVLSPTLFLLHINDLLSLTKNPIYSYADDSSLISTYSSEKPISTAGSRLLRQQQIDSINDDLKTILEWGSRNLVCFNAKKTQMVAFSRKKDNQDLPDIIMEGRALTSQSRLSMLGVDACANLSWDEHVRRIARAASQKLGFLFRAKRYFTPDQLLILYKAQIRPTLEYCSHVWGSAPKHTLALLDTIQKRAVRLVGNESLTGSLHSLEHRRKVGDLTLYYRFFHGNCSAELAALIPPRNHHVRSTRQSEAAHPFAVQLDTSRTTIFKNSFSCRVSELWNSLPSCVFPQQYNLQLFKKTINRHLLLPFSPTRRTPGAQ